MKTTTIPVGIDEVKEMKQEKDNLSIALVKEGKIKKSLNWTNYLRHIRGKKIIEDGNDGKKE